MKPERYNILTVGKIGFKSGGFGGSENLKKSRSKNLSNQINQFHEILFWPNSIFCNSKTGLKSISEQGKI